MIIQVNGAQQEFEQAITLKLVLKKLGFEGKPVVIEYNKEAILPRDYDSIILQHEDSLEIITIAAGG